MAEVGERDLVNKGVRLQVVALKTKNTFNDFWLQIKEHMIMHFPYHLSILYEMTPEKIFQQKKKITNYKLKSSEN